MKCLSSVGTDNLWTFLAMLHSMWDLSSPDQGWNLCPLQCKLRVLTSTPPGKSPLSSFAYSVLTVTGAINIYGVAKLCGALGR